MVLSNPGVTPINTVWLQITNGIAHAAATATPPDQATLGLLQQMVQMMARVGTTYDTATTTTTVYLNAGGQFFPQQFDTMQSTMAQNAGITAAQLGA